MQVLITSDLYHTNNNPDALKKLASNIMEEDPDVFIIAGNINHPLENFNMTLNAFDSLTCPKALITGNRDVWSENNETSSQELWEFRLPEAIASHGFLWLEQNNLIIDRVGICGTTGWYDYTGRDAHLGYGIEQYKELKGLVNNDARYIDWSWSDREFSTHLLDEFRARIESLEFNREIDHIVAITHFPIFKEAIYHIQDDIRWRFGTAYAFNLTLGRLIAPRNKLRHVVSGHSRLRGKWEMNFGNNTFMAHVIGHGDDTAQYIMIDL